MVDADLRFVSFVSFIFAEMDLRQLIFNLHRCLQENLIWSDWQRGTFYRTHRACIGLVLGSRMEEYTVRINSIATRESISRLNLVAPLEIYSATASKHLSLFHQLITLLGHRIKNVVCLFRRPAWLLPTANESKFAPEWITARTLHWRFVRAATQSQWAPSDALGSKQWFLSAFDDIMLVCPNNHLTVFPFSTHFLKNRSRIASSISIAWTQKLTLVEKSVTGLAPGSGALGL
jgi:hypothetical protein